MPKGPFIFDSYALLKFFQKEKGYEKVVHLLEEIKKAGVTKYINAVNLGEIIYSTKREFGDQKKLEVLANIERVNFSILTLSWRLLRITGCQYVTSAPSRSRFFPNCLH